MTLAALTAPQRKYKTVRPPLLVFVGFSNRLLPLQSICSQEKNVSFKPYEKN